MTAYSHNGDAELMRSLGLATAFGRDWTNLGIVTVEEAEPEGEFGPRPAALIEVEASAMPAQFWRFTIVRPRDDAETVGGKVRGVYAPMERFILSTGSGGFGDYWPMAQAVARNMATVERV